MRPDLPGARHRDVDAGGVRLHVAELGDADAPPVVLVHGWPQHWWCWHKVAPVLAREYRCLMPDLRGHGWSQAPPDGYDQQQLARDLDLLLDRLGLDEVHYAGHDWGGYTGFLLALRSPGRIASLLALSTTHLWPAAHDRLDPRRFLALAYQLPIATPLLGRQAVRRGLARELLRRGAPPGTFGDDDLAAYTERVESPEGSRASEALYRAFLLREAPRLASGRYGDCHLQAPGLLLVGGEDRIFKGADLGGHEGNAPRLRVERAPGAKHFLPEERPDLVAQRARELFAAAARGGAAVGAA